MLLNDIWCARQPSTVKQYCYSLRKYFAFCATFGHSIDLPVNCNTAANFISFLKHTAGTRGAISSAINALKWLHNFVPGISQLNDPLNDKMLKMVVEGALRSLPRQLRGKAPLPSSFIDRVLDRGDQSTTLHAVRDCLIITLAYSLLLRHDEVAHISCAHIYPLLKGAKIIIPSSKTDVYKNGGSAVLAEGRVMNLLLKYLKLAGLAVGNPHFLFGPIIRRGDRDCIDNAKLSYNSFRKVLRTTLMSLGFNPDLYGFHSCRSGGATALASHVTQYELLGAGRWKSARSLAHYVKIPTKRKMQFSKLLTG